MAHGANDCNDTIIGDLRCDDFMEWNARAQLTTWYPTPQDATLPGEQGSRDVDYARKQWNGLIRDMHAARAQLYLQQLAQADASAGRPLNTTAMDGHEAAL